MGCLPRNHLVRETGVRRQTGARPPPRRRSPVTNCRLGRLQACARPGDRCRLSRCGPRARDARRCPRARPTGRRSRHTARTFGRILFDGRGFALYTFTRDTAGGSSCTGACARAWPPYIVKMRPKAGPGTTASLLGTIRRGNGSQQVTYAGRPVSTYVETQRAGLCRTIAFVRRLVDPAVRAALDRGRRAPPRPARPRRRAAEAGPRDPAGRARPPCARPTASPSFCGATSGRDDVAGSLQTFVSVLRRHLTADRERARAARRHRAGGVPLRDRARRARPRPLRRAARALRRASRRARSRARSSRRSRLVRGEVLEDEPYATWALDLRGSYQGRVLGARLDAADAALAELDFAAALRARRGGRALDRFSERAQRSADARALRARPTARGARPLPQLPRCGSTRSSGSSRPAETRALEVGDHPPGGRPLAAAPTDPARARRDRRHARSACSAATAELDDAPRAVRRGARRRLAR